MYSDKKNINILTALMADYGIGHIIVCPGSRNAPLIHNFNETGKFRCHSITDERSAGFYALGIAQETGKPAAVCVTSGTALLNLAPAVAEAHYQHLPLLVISADRPEAWIGQQDGQTLVQPGAFGALARKSVNLYEPNDDVQYWHCNRLVNEALMELDHHLPAPVHINVQVAEPLFDFVVPSLPDERLIKRISADDSEDYKAFLDRFVNASKPMLVIGQTDKDNGAQLQSISRYAVVISEATAKGGCMSHIDEMLVIMKQTDDYQPDMIIYTGGDIVSKRLKQFLRSGKSEQWRIDPRGEISDTFMNLTGLIENSSEKVLKDLADRITMNPDKKSDAFTEGWKSLNSIAGKKINGFQPEFSQMAAVKCFEKGLENLGCRYRVHYGNSSAIRMANIFSSHYVRCNRGVNGIEGSLSTAAGMSLAGEEKVFCVIGDLSFFYDQNALWSNGLKGNFRVLLLNNGGGGIFDRVPGLSFSGASDYIMAKHRTAAEGICSQNAVGYRVARSTDELSEGMKWLLNSSSERPLLLEVSTTAEEDNAAWNAYNKEISNTII